MKIPPVYATINLYIGQKLYKLRVQKRHSIKYMAQYLGVSSKTYTQWEQGVSTIKASDLYKLSSLFNVAIAHFFPAADDDIYAKILTITRPPLVPIAIAEDERDEQHLINIVNTFTKFDTETTERLNIFIKNIVKLANTDK